MPTTHTVRTFLALLALSALAPEGTRAAHAASVPNRKLHVIIIGLSQDPALSTGILASRDRLRRTFSAAFQPAEFGSFTEIGFPQTAHPGGNLPAINMVPQFTLQQVNATLGNLTFAEQDVVFCYVMSHGGYASQALTPEREYGQWFETQLTRVPGRYEYYCRVDLFELLLDRRVGRTSGNGLTVLISDACNVRADVPVPVAAPAERPPVPQTVLHNLLMEHTGQVSISASTIGQYSFYFPTGGLFTDNVCNIALWDYNDPNPEFNVRDWPSFMARLTEFTDEDFRGRIGVYHGQRTLTPMWMRDKSFVRPFP
uniref:Caspase family protein n=1 Tax=Schlesneria paludicola TaxID=360056 RepID=A0A7C2K0Z8_9PLAN